jgi:hypothetical protein
VNFTDQSGATGGWHWDFGDGNTSTHQNPTHTYANHGTYTVTLTVDSCSQAYEVSVVSLGTGNELNNPLDMQLYPNPGNDFTKLTVNRPLREDLHLQLVSIEGRKVRDVVLRAGQKVLTIPLEGVAPSVYWLVPVDKYTRQPLKLVVVR